VLERLDKAGHPAEEADDGPGVRDPSGNVLVLAVAP
jgi:hypothetical protein